MRVVTHNEEAREHACHLLAQVGDPISQTRHSIKWIDARLKWEANGILESLAMTGEPVRGLAPGDSAEIDAWAN